MHQLSYPVNGCLEDSCAMFGIVWMSISQLQAFSICAAFQLTGECSLNINIAGVRHKQLTATLRALEMVKRI